MFETIFNSTAANTTITIESSIITMITAFILGAFISITYIKTANKNSYSQNFSLTLILIPTLIAIIILLIGSNVARAFSLAGAFSIIKFRSAPGDPKDIAYVLFGGVSTSTSIVFS